MECVKWSGAFSVGVKEIDEQHQKLVAIMNKLCDAIDKNHGKEMEVIGTVLDELAEYAVVHFDTEEKYFHEFNYEKTEEHEAQHKEFAYKIESLKNDLTEGVEKVTTDTIAYLGQWFAEHVNDHDKQYVQCFHEHGLE
jgi:hemerythrin